MKLADLFFFAPGIILFIFVSLISGCASPYFQKNAEYNQALVQADAAKRNGEWLKSAMLYGQASKLHPDELDLKLKQGQAYRNAGKRDLAFNIYQEIIDEGVAPGSRNEKIVMIASTEQSKLINSDSDSKPRVTSNSNLLPDEVLSSHQQNPVRDNSINRIDRPEDIPIDASPPTSYGTEDQARPSEEAHKNIKQISETNEAVNTEQLKGVVEDWKQAWATKDTVRYLSHYSLDYKGDCGSNAEWRAKRERIIKSSRHIVLKITNLNFDTKENGDIYIKFDQEYGSDKLIDKGLKELIMKKIDGVWLITNERFKVK